MNTKVLIVDDSKLDRFFIRRLLEYLGVNAEEARDGKECIRSVRNSEYDLIFMDYMMPVLSGVETLKQIREQIDNRNESTPIIALVSPDDSSEGRICLESGFQNYLEKPVDFKQLMAILVMYLPDSVRKELKFPSVTAGVSVNSETEQKETAFTEQEIKEEKNTDPNDIYEKINAVDGIDAKQGISFCGSMDGYITALSIFFNSIDSKADEIEQYYKNEDYENYTIKVHALKSSGNLIGAEKLRDRSKEMEDAGNAGDIELIHEKTEPLLEYFRGFKEKLSFLNADQSEKKPEVEPGALSDAYEALAEFADAMDFDLANMVIESMKEFTLPTKDRENFQIFEEKLSALDWDGIKEKLNDYRGGK